MYFYFYFLKKLRTIFIYVFSKSIIVIVVAPFLSNHSIHLANGYNKIRISYSLMTSNITLGDNSSC